MAPRRRRAPDWDASLSAVDGDALLGPEEGAEDLPQPSPLAGGATLEERVASLPACPGVYLMRDAQGRIIYVGKAANLRSRVRQYFRAGGDDRPLAEFLRRRIADVEFVVTTNEKEALLLENTLIKKHRPRYNIQLKDDKTYISLRLDTTHEWPRVHRVRQRRRGDKALYFGPYHSSTGVKDTLRFLQKLFPIRSCPDHVLANRSRPCLLHQIGRCTAPCVGLADRAEYDRNVQATLLFLRGKSDEVADLLRRTMEEYAGNLDFERAAVVRDRLRGLERTMERESVHSHRTFDRDVVALNRSRGTMMATVLYFRRGRLEGTRHFDFRDQNDGDDEVMESFVSQHYAGGRPVPRDVLLAGPVPDAVALARALSELRGGPVRVSVPERGAPRRLAELARHNGREALERHLLGERTREGVLEDLARELGLPGPPHRIECFDISNFQGSFPVGSMTVLLDGEPARGEYRRFKVRSIAGQDDFAAMREVVLRRYRRLQGEGATMPSLVLIDGGKGQLNAACDALRELGLAGVVPIAGIVKSRVLPSSRGTQVVQHSEERVFLPGRKNPVVLNRSNPALFLLVRVRDEAHRFGVAYHRKRRGAAALLSGLEGIAGLGRLRQRALLRHFGSLSAIRGATPAELAAVKGISAELAARILARIAPPGGAED